MWGKDYPIECVVSISTGVAKIETLKHHLPTSLAKAVIAANIDCETAHQNFVRDHMRWKEMSRYFRFNIQNGMETVELDGWRDEGWMRNLGGAWARNPDVILPRKECAREARISAAQCKA